MRGGRRVCYWRGMGVGKYTNDLGGTGRSLLVIYFGPTMTGGGGGLIVVLERGRKLFHS